MNGLVDRNKMLKDSSSRLRLEGNERPKSKSAEPAGLAEKADADPAASQQSRDDVVHACIGGRRGDG